jgi:hypothetical protein
MMEDWVLIGDPLWWRAIQAVAFLCLTYLPLQALAIYRQKGWPSKIVAGMPLVFMLPVIAAYFNKSVWQDGSLHGMSAFCLYVPSMVWVIAGSMLYDRKCAQCGGPLPSLALTRAGLACRNCSKR